MSDDEYDDFDDAVSDVVSDIEDVVPDVADAADGTSDDESEGSDDDDAASTAPAVPDKADKFDKVDKAAGARAPRGDPTVRDANTPVRVLVVPPGERVTDNRLHKSEAAQVLAMRAQQIAKTARVFGGVGPEGPLRDPYALAYRELYARQCPLVLRRQVGVGAAGEVIVEEWSVREMSLPLLRAPY